MWGTPTPWPCSLVLPPGGAATTRGLVTHSPFSTLACVVGAQVAMGLHALGGHTVSSSDHMVGAAMDPRVAH